VSRATATVLFTDLVGSTELRGRLGEEAADGLRRRHDQLLAQAVEANNGRVVKGLGDGIMATFAGASDAVAAAVAIQQAVDRLNRTGKAPVPLAVRVGLSAGDVTFEDDDVHGTPVIEASRLCGAAGGDEIVVSEIVRLLAGLADEDLGDRGRLELKGLQKPVSAWQVRWEPVAVSVIPMPALLTDVGRIFVGRDAELERLTQLWKEAVAGERRVALLAGEPGVGKTRLAAEVAARVYAEGGVVLAGRCDEDLGVPYQPFVEALRHFVDHLAPEELRAGLGRFLGELARLVPELPNLVPELPPPVESDPETERYRLFDGVAGWLAAVEAPLLLVLDDLQWAAKPTLLLLRHAICAPINRLLILGTYRDTELGHGHPLVEVVADLRRQDGVERFSLMGLDSSGVAAFMEQAAGHELDEEDVALARAIYQETEGNPFFVREVFRHLGETGAIERREGRWTTQLPVEELGIPESVRDVVGRRLARLSEAANQALRMAAVVGAEFEVPVLLAAGGPDEDALLSSLEEATQARLIIEAGATYRFAHALVRDTLYGGLSAARQVILHRRVAEAIEAIHAARLDDHLPALAHHWARASAPAADTARAVHYATRAGDRALAQLAHDEAAAFYRQALELIDFGEPTLGQRLDLLLALGEAQRRAGDAAHRQTLLDAAGLAGTVGDVDRLARAALANTRGAQTYTMGVDAEKVTVLESALTAYPPGDSPVRARLLATLGMELIFAGDGDHHLALTAAAVAMARRLGDTVTLAQVLLARCLATLSNPPVLAEFLANSGELLSLTEELGDPYLRANAEHLRFSANFHTGRVEEADKALEAAERAAAETGQPILRWWAAADRAGRVLTAGRIAEAEALIAEVLEIGLATGQPDARQFHATLRFELLYDSGRLVEDVDRLAEAVQNSDRPVLQAMLALALSETGDNDGARALLDPLVPSLAQLSLPSGLWFRTVVPAALAATRLADAALALPLYNLLLPYRDVITGVFLGWSGSASHHLGMLATVLGRFDEAEQHFAAAEATHARIGAPTWLARTRLECARMLLTRRRPGDADRARELLGRALDTARSLGLAKVERDAVALLEDCD
jgi:class 3 adenylate cyclase/tetratricopeptide (TPR) repeat protein